MDNEKELNNIWGKYEKIFAIEKQDKIKEIVGRGFVYSKIGKSDVVLTGINPYCKESKNEKRITNGFKFEDSIKERKKENRYFTNLYDLIKDNKNYKVDYLDLFNFRGEQSVIKYFLKDKLGLEFLCEQLILNKTILEQTKPKLIIVFNKLAHDFFGKNIKETSNNSFEKVWMGYKFDREKVFENGDDLLKIIGITESNGVVGLKETSLYGTLVYFSKYIGRAKKTEKKIIIENLIETSNILNFAKE